MPHIIASRKSVWVGLLASALALLGSSCGTQSRATPYVELTAAEKARKALDERDFAAAVESYQQLLEEEPESYENFPYLATAYAGLAGFELIEAVKSSLNSGGSTSLLDVMGTFLPADPTPEQIEAMGLAKATLMSMPAELRDKANDTISYASGAGLQLEFYQAAYAIMYLNQFTVPTDTGSLDPARLEQMSDQDVDIILGSLEEVAAAGGSGVPEGAASVLAKVDAQEGGSRREKLMKYIKPSNPS